jgi:hypothetical protein
MKPLRPAPRVGQLACGIGGGVCGGTALGVADGLYVLASARPAEYGALVYGGLLYGAAGLILGITAGGVGAVLGPRLGWTAARTWALAAGLSAGMLTAAVLGERFGAPAAGAGAPWLGAAAGAVVAFFVAWLGAHLLSKTPLRVLLSPQGTLSAWALGLLVSALFSVSPAPDAPDRMSPDGAASEPSSDKPDLLLIVVSGLRADAITLATPALAALARDSLVFEQAVAGAGEVGPAIGTLLTSVPPSLHRATVDGEALRSPGPTLAEALQVGGYVTGGLPNHAAITRLRSFDRGFDWYPSTRLGPLGASESAAALALFPPLRAAWQRYAARPSPDAWHTPAARQLQDAMAFLNANAGRPSFLFVHLAEPAPPWFAEDGSAAGGANPAPPERARALYNRDLAGLDAALGAFLRGLRESGRYGRTAIVLTGDCGEELGEGGRVGHGRVLSEGVVRVPLLVKLPDGGWAGTRAPWQVRAVDVAPTLLDLAGLPPPPMWRGAPLIDDWFEDDLARAAPAVDGGPLRGPPPWATHPGSRPALVELDIGDATLVAVRADGVKLTRRRGGGAPGAACFDVTLDPAEQRPLLLDDPRCRRADIADALLEGWSGVRPPPTPAEDPANEAVIPIPEPEGAPGSDSFDAGG